MWIFGAEIDSVWAQGFHHALVWHSGWVLKMNLGQIEETNLGLNLFSVGWPGRKGILGLGTWKEGNGGLVLVSRPRQVYGAGVFGRLHDEHFQRFWKHRILLGYQVPHVGRTRASFVLDESREPNRSDRVARLGR